MDSAHISRPVWPHPQSYRISVHLSKFPQFVLETATCSGTGTIRFIGATAKKPDQEMPHQWYFNWHLLQLFFPGAVLLILTPRGVQRAPQCLPSQSSVKAVPHAPRNADSSAHNLVGKSSLNSRNSTAYNGASTSASCKLATPVSYWSLSCTREQIMPYLTLSHLLLFLLPDIFERFYPFQKIYTYHFGAARVTLIHIKYN